MDLAAFFETVYSIFFEIGAAIALVLGNGWLVDLILSLLSE